MLIETVISLPNGEIAKVQYALSDIRRHQADPANGRSMLTLRQSSPLAVAGAVATWEIFAVLSARLATLSDSNPVALMSDEDWNAAASLHGG